MDCLGIVPSLMNAKCLLGILEREHGRRLRESVPKEKSSSHQYSYLSIALISS